jgi:selenocysteine lyase/cysteine desulfurase
VANHLLHRNVQRGGRYKQSREVDEAIAQARASVALLVNARHPDEISFGMNAPLSCGSSASPLVKR